jgi:hypothetical protein
VLENKVRQTARVDINWGNYVHTRTHLQVLAMSALFTILLILYIHHYFFCAQFQQAAISVSIMDNNILNLISSFATRETEPPPPVETGGGKLTAVHTSHGIMCFSKDRPFQLEAFIESCKLRFMPSPKSIVVLYTSSEAWAPHYDMVFANHKDVIAVKEKQFHTDFLSCLNLLTNNVDTISLCVDDMVFFSDVPMWYVRLLSLTIYFYSDIVCICRSVLQALSGYYCASTLPFSFAYFQHLLQTPATCMAST